MGVPTGGSHRPPAWLLNTQLEQRQHENRDWFGGQHHLVELTLNAFQRQHFWQSTTPNYCYSSHAAFVFPTESKIKNLYLLNTDTVPGIGLNDLNKMPLNSHYDMEDKQGISGTFFNNENKMK